MALFTDGLLGNVEDLHRYDSSVLSTAAAEGVDLTTKLQLSQLELGMEVAGLLRRNDAVRPGSELGNVLVTEPLLHAQCVHALELVYRDAHNNQLNDRFAGKASEYSKRYRKAIALLGELGVALVTSPVKKAHNPVYSYASGGSLPDSTYFLSVRLVDAAGFAGAGSDIEVMQVPSGTLPTAVCLTSGVAVGWHVFAGTSSETLYRQTVSPLSSGAFWSLDPLGIRTDVPSLPDLPVARYVRDGCRLRRG